jgi:integrase
VASNGGSVIEYAGKRGTVWRLKFTDSSGKQVMQTPKEQKGWKRRDAERALGAKLEEISRTRWRQPERVTFAAFADRFRSEVIPARGLKPTTVEEYETILRVHLIPFFGTMELAAIEPEDVDKFIAARTKAGSSPKTIQNYLSLLTLMFKTARRWRLVVANPVEDATPPRSQQKEMRVLTAAEVARLITAYGQLEQAPPEQTTAEQWRQTRRLITFAVSTGLRRGEALALRWSAVELLTGKVTIRETFTRGRFGTPKSQKSLRTIDIGPVAVAALTEQWEETKYRSDNDLVFCHPALGSPLHPSHLSNRYLRPALTKAGIEGTTTFHCLRHTALTAAAAAGLGPHYVQALAGHSSVSIGERYVHLATSAFAGAAEATEGVLFRSVESSVES